MDTPMFSLGKLVITRAALDVLHQEDVRQCLARHASCDWGDLGEHDKRENNVSLAQNLRLLSAYHDRDRTKFWIITEADRSVTTVLLPADY